MSLCSIPIQYSMSRRFTPSNAFESISSSFPPRNLDWLPLMRTSWGTPFPRRAFPPFAEKVPALINMPMPTDVTQVRALMGGINYYRKILPDLSKRLRPNNSLLRKGSRGCVQARYGKIGARNLGGACDSADSGFPHLGRGRRWFTSVPRVRRRLHRRVWRRPRTRAGGRFHKTHRVYQPTYA